ncbi:arylesterase [Neptunomonas phycophila]|uniref:arylesterase n=1 Tax=Neptunomonas TaxID=75687 RepID=UPI0015C013F6|nr:MULTISPECIES: arylesterase [Neptunomonas]MBT3145545.1 arylesterase [Neptunomonas phycophila]MDO6469168.1 arylesterase [Neptunomonas phycophila]MDO6784502.1 arylesterase [Neptunomonas phycophila]QLE96145.1 arylesterase [Neptunomonas phycophila]
MSYFRLVMLSLALIPMLAWNNASAQTLLVLGDSLSAAYRLKPEEGWVALLQNRLVEQGSDIKVVNASISGETTQGGLTRLPELLNRHQPNWIVLELGANDGLRATPIPRIEQNLRALIDQSQEAGAEPIIVGIQLPPNYGPRYTRRFFGLYESLAQEYELARVPFLLEDVALKPELMQSDGLHPTAEAQPIVLEQVWPTLSSVMLAD